MPSDPRTSRTSRARTALLAVPLVLAAGLGACAGGVDLGAATDTGVSSSSDTGSGTGTGTGLTEQDGYLPDGASLSPDADEPALTRLQPALRAALQDAARAAAADGIEVRITSGWRSAALQQALFDAAVVEHGSVEAASAYVLRPDESEHVTGDAVDVGPTDAMDWMSRHGSDHGLCQTYANELWHYELATTPGTDCPPPLTDARHAHDARDAHRG
ncbi:M15 family metallopeptidase [Blastococcus sp. SYSU D00695]